MSQSSELFENLIELNKKSKKRGKENSKFMYTAFGGLSISCTVLVALFSPVISHVLTMAALGAAICGGVKLWDVFYQKKIDKNTGVLSSALSQIKNYNNYLTSRLEFVQAQIVECKELAYKARYGNPSKGLAVSEEAIKKAFEKQEQFAKSEKPAREYLSSELEEFCKLYD